MTPFPSKPKPAGLPDGRSTTRPGKPDLSGPNFYSPDLTSQESSDLQAVMARGLEDEIAMLRMAARRMLDLSGNIDSPKEMASVLGSLGLVSTRLGRLLRIQFFLQGQGAAQDTSAAISQALQEVVSELSGGKL